MALMKGLGYTTYRVDVPIDQIAWQINLTPGLAGQNPNCTSAAATSPTAGSGSANT